MFLGVSKHTREVQQHEQSTRKRVPSARARIPEVRQVRAHVALTERHDGERVAQEARGDQQRVHEVRLRVHQQRPERDAVGRRVRLRRAVARVPRLIQRRRSCAAADANARCTH